MKKLKITTTVLGMLGLLFAVGVGYQNCAKSKFNNPDPKHAAFAQGLCKNCADETGTGITCRPNTKVPFGACIYESCKSGFQMEANICTPVVCEADSLANCVVPHGEGRKKCKADQKGYDECVPTTCDSGYVLTDSVCTTITFCDPGSHRDCSTESTFGLEVCNEQGSGYNACVFGACKPGFAKDDTDTCVPVICEPTTITPCTEGAGYGFKTCNSQGTGWGSCVLNGCQAGYTLQNNVCVIQACTPGSSTVCEFDHGIGEKICNQNGMDYGPCTLVACEPGYVVQNGQCVGQVCTPNNTVACIGESGSGQKTCDANGLGYGPCILTTCDEGFELKNNQCVANNFCDQDLTCTQQHGTGLRTCNKHDHVVGPCVLNHCFEGYELVLQGAANVCKKIK